MDVFISVIITLPIGVIIGYVLALYRTNIAKEIADKISPPAK